MSTESVLPDNSPSSAAEDAAADTERMRQYRILALAFSYPDQRFFSHFKDLDGDADSIRAEYDRLFRASDVWLYGAEYMAENEFQRARLLADIMGFYKAFALEPDRERPDALACEMEFMAHLIFKAERAAALVDDDGEEKSNVCRDAERKFFAEHLGPAATHLANKVLAASDHAFYKQVAEELLVFLECERNHFGLSKLCESVVETGTGRPAVAQGKVKEEITDE